MKKNKNKKMKLFKVIYPNGTYNFIISYNSWAGMIPLAQAIGADYDEAIVLRGASIWEAIRYFIKGV